MSYTILAIWGSRMLISSECPSISTKLCVVESHPDFLCNVLKLGFVANDSLVDCGLSIQSFGLAWCYDFKTSWYEGLQ